MAIFQYHSYVTSCSSYSEIDESQQRPAAGAVGPVERKAWAWTSAKANACQAPHHLCQTEAMVETIMTETMRERSRVIDQAHTESGLRKRKRSIAPLVRVPAEFAVVVAAFPEHKAHGVDRAAFADLLQRDTVSHAHLTIDTCLHT